MVLITYRHGAKLFRVITRVPRRYVGLEDTKAVLIYEKFIVHTDHAAYHWVLSSTDPSGRLIRWYLRLSESYFEVKFKNGKANTQAYALYRLITDGETIRDGNDEIPAFNI